MWADFHPDSYYFYDFCYFIVVFLRTWILLETLTFCKPKRISLYFMSAVLCAAIMYLLVIWLCFQRLRELKNRNKGEKRLRKEVEKLTATLEENENQRRKWRRHWKQIKGRVGEKMLKKENRTNVNSIDSDLAAMKELDIFF